MKRKEEKKKFKCESKNPNEPCKEHYMCYVDSPEHYNCFFVYMFYNNEKSHTLQETAKLLNKSHTTIKCIQDSGLEKLKKEVAKNRDLKLFNPED